MSLTTRTNSTTFDAQGRFPVSTTNAAGHQTSAITHDARFGVTTGSTAPNGIRSETRYDGFGRKTLESVRDSSGNLIAQSAMRFDAFVSGNERYVVHTRGNGGAESKSYFDQLQREIRGEVKTFSGSFVSASRVSYNTLGQRVSAAKLTAASGGNSVEQVTSWSYDPLNRMTREDRPDGGQTLYGYAVEVYEGHPRAKTTLTARNPSDLAQDQVTSRLLNSQAQVIRLVDAHNKPSTYHYDALGNLTRVVGPTGITKAMSYDLRGRKESMSDPDMGNWTYGYNGAGELKTQSDARASSTAFDYDALSRPLVRTEGAIRTDWSYDSCARGIGQLCRVQTGNISREILYDDQARPYRSQHTLVDRSYVSHSLHDREGRLSFIGYPLSKLDQPALGVRQRYNASGYLHQVVDAITGVSYWQALSRYADGQLYQARLGNSLLSTQSAFDSLGRLTQASVPGIHGSSYSFNRLGNLADRTINIAGAPPLSQSFAYDKLNRMTSFSGSGGPHTFSFDDAGNLLSRSDVPGAYSYVNGTHRLSQQGIFPYSYDGNGNVLSDGRRTVVPNAFNLPTTISQGGTTLSYFYDAEHQRVIEQVSGGATTYYIGSSFFEEVLHGGNQEWRHYIASPEGVIALVSKSSYQPNSTRYWHKDHLGSIIAVSNEGGALLQGFHFTPWGGRSLVIGGGAIEPRGYTGHEMLDEVGFIHMNGRIYDPFLGRFISPDPIVNAPFNPQDLNRYAYVLNNPLLYVDPTGFSWWTTWRRPIIAIAAAVFVPMAAAAIWGSALGVTSAMAAAEGISFLQMAAAMPAFGGAGVSVGFVSAIAGGFAAGGIAGGNLQSAVYGALTAGAFYGVGELSGQHGLGSAMGFGSSEHAAQTLGHAVVGCASAAAQGGSCKAGAASAGFAALAGPMLPGATGSAENFISHLVVGGTASRLSGDSFANGAVTAAFGYLFNQAAANIEECRTMGCTNPGLVDAAKTTGEVASTTGDVLEEIYIGGVIGKGIGWLGRAWKGLFSSGGSGPIWSSTKNRTSVENAFEHWQKHRDEFPELQNSKQYVEKARSFLTNPPKGTLTKANARGDTLRYDPNTNTFGVLSKDGAPRTMFRPKDGMDYWNRQ